MRRASLRIAAALMLCVITTWCVGRVLHTTPLYRYSFEWFLKLGPGERLFYALHLAGGGIAVWLLSRALEPVLAERWPAIRPAFTSSRVLWVVSVFGAALAALIGFVLLRDQVVTDDEYVYLFQSHLLLEGHASAAPPPLALFFTNTVIGLQEGRWFGQYPPGHPLVLAPALLLGEPRLMPILLVGLNVFLTGLLVGRIMGSGWGIAAALLLVTSPLFLLTGGTLLSHGTAYFALVLGTYGALRVSESGGWAWSLVCGAGIGLLVLTRPWTGVTLGIFPGLWLWRAARSREDNRVLWPALLVLFASAVFFLLYNREQTGHPLLTGYDAIRRGGGQIEFGFGPIIPGVFAHTFFKGLRNAALLVLRFHAWSWAWPIALLPVLYTLKRRRSRANNAGLDRGLVRGAWWMLAVGFAAYVPYWSIGVNDTGPVKTYELLLPFTVLTVAGTREWARARGAAAPAAWILASFLAGLLVFWPATIRHLDQLSRGVAAPLEAIERGVERPAVVFVPDPGFGDGESWVFGRPNPRPDLSDPVLYVRDLGAADRDLLRALPGRRGYRFQRLPGDVRLLPIP
ncbi:MAG TPA: glycosyltransferase family 39 protein [Candidatus Eisenbacteria bacterium]|nr:glycosyltransferase family 39 protein [Candidatus Eisenbacteria bacterium]